jgi:predicted PurR-regulated permease PerM
MAVLIPPLTEQRQGAGTAVIGAAAAIALLYFGRIFFITVTISLVVALLLEPVVAAGMRLRLPRYLASLLACLIALGGVFMIGFGAYAQILGLKDDLPAYGQRIGEMVDTVTAQVDSAEAKIEDTLVPKRLREIEQPATPQPSTGRRKKKPVVAPAPVPAAIPEVRIRQEPKSILLFVYGYLRSAYDGLLMASFVPFLVYFMLSWRDHVRKGFLGLLAPRDRHIAGRTWQGITQIARAYVLGNFILGVLLSVASCAIFFFMGLPYWLVTGILSGFLSLMPYVGVPLAITPPMLAGLTEFMTASPYLVIVIAVGMLHLIAMNFLYPRVVGGRLHLNPLAVTLALMFWGTIWGAIGLVLAIPLTAGVKAVCDNVPAWGGYGKILGD